MSTMPQLSLGLEVSPPQHDRRIDITLARLAEIHESMSNQDRAELDGKPWWITIVTVSRLRAMERAEEEALGRPSKGLADAYDRVVSPGEHAGNALLRTFRAVYGPDTHGQGAPTEPAAGSS